MKWVVLFICVTILWSWATKSGISFSLVDGRPTLSFTGRKPEISQEIQAKIQQIDADIATAQNEMSVLMMRQAQGMNMRLRTDPVFLERRIDRLKNERALLLSPFNK